MSVAIAIGTFDGVHLGHRRVVEEAVTTGLPVRALTFHPHPRSVITGNLVELITTLERRLELLAELGVSETAVIEFTLDLAGQPPEQTSSTRSPATRRSRDSPWPRRCCPTSSTS